MDFKGKVAIVTGASTGLGRAYALALAGAGATVVAAARGLGSCEDPQPDTLAEVVAASEGLAGRLYGQACDITIEQDVERLVEETVVNFGRIDVLVNNAGAFPRSVAFAVNRELWDSVMDLNLWGAYLAIRYAAPHMMRQRSGSIVNITAAAGLPHPRGHPAHDKMLVYALSKAGLNRLTSFVAEELRDYGVAVNAMSPGFVVTRASRDNIAKATPAVRAMAKPATAEVMGPPLLYLAGQTADTLTAQILHHDEFGKSWG